MEIQKERSTKGGDNGYLECIACRREMLRLCVRRRRKRKKRTSRRMGC
jgi:hypothetical protein